METADAGAGERSSGLEVPGSTDDRLFLVKGVLWGAAGVGASAPPGSACAGAGIPTSTPSWETSARGARRPGWRLESPRGVRLVSRALLVCCIPHPYPTPAPCPLQCLS